MARITVSMIWLQCHSMRIILIISRGALESDGGWGRREGGGRGNGKKLRSSLGVMAWTLTKEYPHIYYLTTKLR